MPKTLQKKKYTLWTIPKAEWGTVTIARRNCDKKIVLLAVKKSAKERGQTFRPVSDVDLPAVKLD